LTPMATPRSLGREAGAPPESPPIPAAAAVRELQSVTLESPSADSANQQAERLIDEAAPGPLCE
jgi:hypothetical protein